MRPSAEKTNQCFFFALSNVIGLASLVFKPSSTTRATDLRDVGKTILIFSNIYSNLTKSLYEGTKCRLIVVKIPCLRQQSSNSGKTLKITSYFARIFDQNYLQIRILGFHMVSCRLCWFSSGGTEFYQSAKFPVFLFKGFTSQYFGCFLVKTFEIRFPIAFTCG